MTSGTSQPNCSAIAIGTGWLCNEALGTVTCTRPALAVGALVLTGFVIAEARSDHRSFDVTLFKNRGYTVSLTVVTLSFFAMNGITFTLPFFLQTLRGYSTLTAGLCFLPFAIGQIIAAPRSAGMVNRFGYKKVMTLGMSIVTLSLLVLSFALHLDTPLWLILVVFFFLRSFRATLIPVVTIPASMLGAFAIMYALGFTVNTLTLLAMVLAIGLVVDDAIVVVENIHRHLEEGKTPVQASLQGAREIVGKIVPDLLQRLGKMQFRPGQAPQIARRTVRALELQRLIDPFPRCRSHDPLLARSDHMHAARRDPHGDGTGRTGRIQCAVAGIPRTRTVLITGNVRVHAVPEVDGVMLLKSLLHSALQTPGLTRVLPVRQWVPTGV